MQDDIQAIARSLGEIGDSIPEVTDVAELKPKKRRRDQRTENDSELKAPVALKAVGILMRVLRKVGGQLDNWYIRFHTRGFDILDIQIRLRNEKFKEIISSAISKQYPGARHHFNDNPTVYAFLAINNRMGKIIRNKLGLDYAAYDDGKGGISLSITEPPVETPPDENFVDETEAEAPAAPPPAAPAPGGMPGPMPGAGPMPMGGGGMPPLDMGMPGGPGPELPPGGIPPEQSDPNAPPPGPGEEDIANIAAGMPEPGQEDQQFGF